MVIKLNIIVNKYIMPITCTLCNQVTTTKVIRCMYYCTECNMNPPIYKCWNCDKYLCEKHLEVKN